MEVKVCDALCGSGKTLSCINMMNNDRKNKYIFITPYLNEVERIKDSCKSRNFISPERKRSSGYSKLKDIHSLLRAGENIVSTHALFSTYTEETRELLQANNYILVLDEVIDLFQPVGLDGGDVNMLVRKNIAKTENNSVIWDDDEYTGVLFSEVMRMSKSNNLIDYDGSFFFWALPIEVFKCFKSVYVLTYMFEYQMLKHFFHANSISYELIGTKKENNIYQFCPLKEMDRRIDLRNKIHIYENEKYNEIGNKNYSLSSSWFGRAYDEPGQPKLTILKNNIYNVFRKADNGDKLWTTLNKYKNSIKGRGYSNSFLTFNKRATNDFADRHYLAYCLNVYLMPWMKNYLIRVGAGAVNQDMYALSVLIQWIFRSAVRKGEEIWVYVPSKRMRWLLTRWVENLAAGDDLKELNYNYKKEGVTLIESGFAFIKTNRKKRK